jgi:hypothetical protein
VLHLDPRLAQDVADRLGIGRIDAPGQVTDVVARFGRSYPIGTIAKTDAIDTGRTPPGAEPDECATAWLAEVAADGRPVPEATSWTCWPLAVLFAGVLGHVSDWDVTVAVGRNVGDLDGNPPGVRADFHSLIEIDTGDGPTLVVDPLFFIGPLAAGRRWQRGPWTGELVDLGPEGWLARWATPSRNGNVYRRIGGRLDNDDIAAFVDVSVSHSGWQSGRTWRLADVDAIASVHDEPGGGAVASLRRYVDGGWQSRTVECHAWVDATAAAIAHLWDDDADVARGTVSSRR